MKADPEVLRGLLERCQAARGGDGDLDQSIAIELSGWCPHWNIRREGYQDDTGFVCEECGADSWGNKSRLGQRLHDRCPPTTSSVDAALILVSRALPGWWVTSGLCSLSGHASIGPDYNGPAGERLKAEFPPERFDHGGFDADLSPGDGPHRQCYAILAALLTALLASQEPGTGGER